MRQVLASRRSAIPWRRRQAGAFAVMFIPLLLVMIGFCGLALDMGQLYNRRVDMHGMAKAAALAAARELNGTPAGIEAARNAARETAERLRYHAIVSGSNFSWRDEALSFGTSAAHGGEWVPASVAGGAGNVGALYFAKVDTAGLDQAMSTVATYFIGILSSNLASIRINDSAVAGRSSVKVTPIGICAMSPDAASERVSSSGSGPALSELVQFGFRRGVSYDLMQLNPNGIEPLRYALNPVAAPGSGGANFSIASLGPFVCSGAMWVQRLTGGAVRVSELPSSAPLESLYGALNTRFDNYAGTPCSASGAPPDINIRAYAYDQNAVVKWMTPTIGSPAAATTTVRGKRETVADLTTEPASPGSYGPLWAYAKAVRAPSPLNAPEPAGGYPVFATADWATLYKSGPGASGYPGSPPAPYLSSSPASGNYLAPRLANKPLALPHRRVLNIPLLACSPAAPAGSNVAATVVGIGKFFMTVPATQNSLVGEFAGLLPQHAVSGHVELYP